MSAMHLIELAQSYLDKFPHESSAYTTQEFDQWAWSRNVPRQHRLPKLDENHAYGPRHPEWGSHTYRRHGLKNKINSGGRAFEDNDDKFQIVVNAPGLWQTCPIVEAATGSSRSLAHRITTAVKTKLMNVRKVVKSTDLPLLSSETQAMFSNLTRLQNEAEQRMLLDAMLLENGAREAMATAQAEIIQLRENGNNVGELEFLLNLTIQPPEQLAFPWTNNSLRISRRR